MSPAVAASGKAKVKNSRQFIRTGLVQIAFWSVRYQTGIVPSPGLDALCCHLKAEAVGNAPPFWNRIHGASVSWNL
jgi:hypothetical protein